jgi:hypothetical protein
VAEPSKEDDVAATKLSRVEARLDSLDRRVVKLEDSMMRGALLRMEERISKIDDRTWWILGAIIAEGLILLAVRLLIGG